MKSKINIIYDMASMPEELTAIEVLIEIPKQCNALIWNSNNGGKEPIVTNEEVNLHVVDYDTPEGRVILERMEKKK